MLHCFKSLVFFCIGYIILTSHNTIRWWLPRLANNLTQYCLSSESDFNRNGRLKPPLRPRKISSGWEWVMVVFFYISEFWSNILTERSQSRLSFIAMIALGGDPWLPEMLLLQVGRGGGVHSPCAVVTVWGLKKVSHQIKCHVLKSIKLLVIDDSSSN